MASINKTFVPPHSMEAERAVLGAILRNPNEFNLIVDRTRLDSKHFYADSHRMTYATMQALEQANQPIDLLTLTEKLFKDQNKQAFNPSYIIELTESCPVAQNVEYYASIVREKYYLRRIINACNTTIQKAATSEQEALGFIEEIEREFLEITNEQDIGEGLKQAKDVLHSTLEELEKRIEMDTYLTGVPSGFIALDKLTGGWQKSDLIILAARPGMGKTALALNFVINAIKTQDLSAAVFTLEMSRNQVMERFLSAEGRIDSTKLRKGELNDDDQDRLMQAARVINKKGTKIVIDETPGISVAELRSRCRRYQKEHGLHLIVVDYLQLMSASTTARKQGREREISEISMGLKALAKELKIPIIAAAQLNRGPDARPDKRPRISDLRESGSMEQDADQIIFIYRDDYYNPQSEHAGQSEVIIAKNRHGETATVRLAWLANYVAFHNLMQDS